MKLDKNERVVYYNAGVAGSSCVRQRTGAGTIPKGAAHSALNNLSNEPLFLLLRALQVNISEEVSYDVTYFTILTEHPMISLVDCHL